MKVSGYLAFERIFQYKNNGIPDNKIDFRI